MHRHGYQGRKLSRERDQRRALLKGLATSLITEESITTTLPKAKEVLPYVEKLITKAKKGDLHNRRQVISALSTLEAVDKLFDTVATATNGRNSGHLRIEKNGPRRGDSAPMATVSFVDDLSTSAKKIVPKEVKAAKAAKTEEKPKAVVKKEKS